MPLLLAESAKLSTDLVQRGVIETILEESPMLRVLPFLEVEGNSFKFNQENTLGGAAFDGLKTLLPSTGLSGQVITPAAGGGSLTLALLDQLIDLVKGGKPDLLLM